MRGINFSHVRDIYISVTANQAEFRIPLYFEKLKELVSVKFDKDNLIVIFKLFDRDVKN